MACFRVAKANYRRAVYYQASANTSSHSDVRGTSQASCATENGFGQCGRTNVCIDCTGSIKMADQPGHNIDTGPARLRRVEQCSPPGVRLIKQQRAEACDTKGCSTTIYALLLLKEVAHVSNSFFGRRRGDCCNCTIVFRTAHKAANEFRAARFNTSKQRIHFPCAAWPFPKVR